MKWLCWQNEHTWNITFFFNSSFHLLLTARACVCGPIKPMSELWTLLPRSAMCERLPKSSLEHLFIYPSIQRLFFYTCTNHAHPGLKMFNLGSPIRISLGHLICTWFLCRSDVKMRHFYPCIILHKTTDWEHLYQTIIWPNLSRWCVTQIWKVYK